MTLNVPHEFIPQTQQTISSTQVDQNFAAIETWGNALEAQILGGSGNADTITSQKTFTQWPLCTAVTTLPQNGIVTKAVLDILQPIGSLLWLTMPKLPPIQYGIEYKWPNGQQVDLATYQALYTYLTSLTPSCAGVALVTGSSPQKFTLPDLTGALPQIANTLGGLGANRITGSRADMANLSTPCGVVGAQGFTLVGTNLPVGASGRPTMGGGAGLTTTGNLGPGGYPLAEVATQTPCNFSPTSVVLYPAMRVL